jgi:hypothetical protein
MSVVKRFLQFRRALRRMPARRRLEAHARVFIAVNTMLLLCATVLHREDSDGYQAAHLFFMPRHTWEMDHGRGMLYEEAYYRAMDLEVLAEEVYGQYAEREREYRAPGAAVTPASTSTAAYSDWLAAEREAYTRWFAQHKGEYTDWLNTEATTFDRWLAARPADYRAAYEAELASLSAPAEAGAEPFDAAESLSSGRRTQGQTVRRAPHAPASGGSDLPILSAVAELDPPSYHFEPVRLPDPSPISREDDTPYPPPRPQDSL